jgi:two-component system LytT family response regulator
MIRTLIIDDEPKNIRILRGLLQTYCPQIQIIGEANGFHKALELIDSTHPDLLFLDIEMPYGNAFDLLEKIMPVKFEIIFVTAFNDYALKAFKYSALDYLLKPVNIDELKTAVAKAEQKLNQKSINFQLNNLINNFRKTELQKIALPLIDGLIFVPVSEITYLHAKGSYTDVHLQNGDVLTTARTIKDYEDMLSPDIFCRVHHSYLICVNHIKKYSKGRGGLVEMEDGALIEVSIRKKDEFLSRFGL